MIHRHGTWTVEVSNDPEFRGDHFDAAFRRAVKIGRECEMFTLFDDDRPQSENAILQILMFDDGLIQIWCYAPCMVQCHRDERIVLVGIRQSALPPPPPGP